MAGSRSGGLPLVVFGLVFAFAGCASDATARESFWSSGDDAPGWIQVDFPEEKEVVGIRFVVYQNPESETIHQLEVLIDGSWSVAETFAGFTSTGDILDWRPGSPMTIKGFRMTTLASASWPEWLEIEIDPA